MVRVIICLDKIGAFFSTVFMWIHVSQQTGQDYLLVNFVFKTNYSTAKKKLLTDKALILE